MPRLLKVLQSLAKGRLAVARVKVAEEAPPSSAYSAGMAALQELVSSLHAYIPSVSHHLDDKSQSELIFLAAVLLTLLLTVVIVPACEALLGPGDKEEDGGLLSVAVAPRGSNRVYKPGVGVVCVNAGGMADAPLSRASSSGSSCGSCSMETIEESEEENLEDDDHPCVGEGRKKVRIVAEASSSNARSIFAKEEP